MKRFYIFFVAAIVLLAGFMLTVQDESNVVTVVENAKVAYDSCGENGHTYDGDYKVILVANCTSKGTMYRTCTVCKYKDIIETEKDPDNHTALDKSEWIYFPEATCVESGIRYHVCRACNAKADIETVPENENSHKGSGQYVIIKEATCSVKGEQAEICALCSGYCNYTEIAYDMTKHTVSDSSKSKITVNPTCAKEGVIVTYCDYCNNVAVTTPVPATGNHVPNKELIIDVAPNCTYEGSCSYHCVVCDKPMYVQPLKIEPDNHEYGDFVIDKAATCVSAGEKSKYCKHCNHRTDITEIPADINAHDYAEEWVVTKEATCAEMGLKHKVCNLCGCNSVPVMTEKTEHTYSDDYETIKVSADGVTAQVKYTCTVCGAEHITIINIGNGNTNNNGGSGESTESGYYRLIPVKDTVVKIDYTTLLVSNVAASQTLKMFRTNFENLESFKVFDRDNNLMIPADIIGTGFRLNYRDAKGKITNYYVCVKGDINGDGAVSAEDARKVLRASADIEALNNIAAVAADVNDDGTITAEDARIILRVSAQLQDFNYGTE